MTLQSSGAISLNDIQNEFGGSNPISIDEYYGVDSGVPTSGTISLDDFYGTSDTNDGTVTVTVGIRSGKFLTEWGYRNYQYAYGSRSGNLNNASWTRGLFYFSGGGFLAYQNGNRSKGWFTRVTPQGGNVLWTSQADLHSYNSSDNLTLWRWDNQTVPSGWQNDGWNRSCYWVAP